MAKRQSCKPQVEALEVRIVLTITPNLQVITDVGMMKAGASSPGHQIQEIKVVPNGLVPSPDQPKRKRIFLAHGHNEAAREAVARLIESLGFEVVILHERTNEGRTILEKLDANSDVVFAVAIVTGDDRGGPAGASPAEFRPRARQNVIFELGLLQARCGRGKVCVLHEAGVELPSDLLGLVLVEMDPNRAWRLNLAREMDAAGLELDFKRLAR